MGLDKPRAASDMMPVNIGMGDSGIYFTSLELVWRMELWGHVLVKILLM